MKGQRKHRAVEGNETPASKSRLPLEKEMEEAQKTHKSVRVKSKKVEKQDEAVLNEQESKKIVKSAMKQLKEEKDAMEEEKVNEHQQIEELEQDEAQMMEMEDLESDGFEDSEDDKDNEEYDVNIDEETKKLLSAFSQDVQVVDVNTMISQQYEDIKKEEKKEKQKEQNNQIEGKEKTIKEKVYPQKVKKIFEELGTFLSHYHVGKLPRVFKLLPSFEEWIPLLQMTNPSQWTPHSLFAATRLFLHTTNSETEQFFKVFLYPIIRHSIHQNKKLHFQEYLALKKAVYRPQAFFKGLIFPLCQEKDVTLKEATIIASILHKVSIPSKHSAVALYKLSTMEYNSTQALFLKTLLDKKYSLPYAALDAVANYYIGFIDKKVDTPLLWHQGLLVFVQRYSKDFKPQQVQQLLRLCQVHRHHAITPLVIVQLQKQKD
ncbi:cell adhesion protein byn-1, putative [Entamoeba dispar SAW760]|uniref:Bystin n=1 Tax=Entamoeba dispar (strain ATCC PRA-260 / SAW760) TaxID=370354 RepID=B0EGH4_ENTDS|nr:cell adhesion protein byn-1, putative [Entamoeba dispar SAW760]EDR26353.1 cell adhesion protein byn-1, putative [Entamoeba dispar SAW760]|eukprot:EDR26353.1 cell adhesion protein byn-1, putative [Entamoeba dispar SAW760]